MCACHTQYILKQPLHIVHQNAGQALNVGLYTVVLFDDAYLSGVLQVQHLHKTTKCIYIYFVSTGYTLLGLRLMQMRGLLVELDAVVR